MTKPKILCYIRDTGPLGGIIWAAEGDPGAMAVVEADGRLTATPLYEGVGSESTSERAKAIADCVSIVDEKIAKWQGWVHSGAMNQNGAFGEGLPMVYEIRAALAKSRGRIMTPLQSATQAAESYLQSQRALDGLPAADILAELVIAAYEKAGGAATLSARDVLVERERQKSVEGWTAEHDDGHTRGEMAKAAGCYAIASAYTDFQREAYAHDWFSIVLLRRWWPWDHQWWKPKDRRRDLVKAGALILAEIERLDRAAISKPEGDGK